MPRENIGTTVYPARQRAERNDVFGAALRVVDDGMKVDKWIMPMRVLIGERLNVCRIEAADRGVRAIGSAKRVRDAAVPLWVVPHVLGIHPPGNSIGFRRPWDFVELIADRSRAVRSKLRRRKHAAITNDLAGELSAVGRVCPWQDVGESSEERRQLGEVDAVVVGHRRRCLARYL